MLETIGFVILAYLCGSIASAILVCKVMRLPDPRTQGSGNPGTTNVLRIGGKGVAITVLILDVLKGLIPVLIANYFGLHGFELSWVAFAAVVGHMYPIFFKFKGGKGVATFIGVLFGINVLLGVIFVIIWLLVAAITRYSSLAALIATVISPFAAVSLVEGGCFLPLLLTAILIVYRHRGNIERLINRTEPKIGKKKTDN